MFDPYKGLVPIFLETDIPRSFRQIGSAVFVRVRGIRFLFTAAHVLDELERGQLLVPTSNGIEPIEGYYAFKDLLPEETREEDQVDMGYYKLSNHFADRISEIFTPIDMSNIQLIRHVNELSICSVSGYPASKAKKKGNEFSSEVYSYTGVVVGPDIYEKHQLNPEFEIVIGFTQKTAVNVEGQPFPTPSLKGLSGGGIFAWPNEFDGFPPWSERKLVGIMHSYKKRDNLIVGTNMIAYLAGITKHV